MIPVEAQACGAPVIGLRRGGLLETVVDGETGFFVDSLHPRDYVPFVSKVDGLTGMTAAHTARFSPQAFATNIRAWITRECAS